MLPTPNDEPEDRFGLRTLPLLLRVEDLTKALSIGRTHAHVLMSTELDVVKLGRATRITRASVIRMVERSLTASPPEITRGRPADMVRTNIAEEAPSPRRQPTELP